MNSAHQRESNDTIDESDEGNYENYGRNSLPEGYTPYRGNGPVIEAVYDRYNTEYSETSAEEAKPNSCSKNKSCCKIGVLSKFQIFNERSGALIPGPIIGHKRDFMGQAIKKTREKDSHQRKVPNIVHMQLIYFSIIQNLNEQRDSRTEIQFDPK